MNEADLTAMPGEAEKTSAAQTPELIPFQDWVEKTRPPEDDPLGKFRGYSGYVRQSLLEQGRWSDTLVGKIDERLAGLAIESGAYAMPEGTEPTIADVLAPPPEKNIPAEELLDYAMDLDSQVLRETAARYIALRDGGESIAASPEDYVNQMAAAEADIRSAFTDDDMRESKRNAVRSGKSLAALVRTPDGYEDVEISDELMSYVNPDGTMDDRGLATALKLSGTDPMLIPGIRAKLATPEGYDKPLAAIQKSVETRTALDALSRSKDEIRGFKLDETIGKLTAGIERGENPDTWGWVNDTAMFELKQRVQGTPLADLSDDELRTQMIDLAKSRLNPEIDPADPAAALQKLSTGEVVIPPSVMLNREYFEKAVTDPAVPLAQRDGLRQNRALFMEENALSVTTTLANDPQGGDGFLRYQEAELAKGKKQSEIVEGWISQGNFSAPELYARGIGSSVPEAVRTLAFAIPAMAGNEYALGVLKADQQADANRRAYAELFGFKPGIGYDVGRLVAPVAVDILVSKGISTAATSTAKATAGGAVKAFIRSSVSAETKGIVQSWARGGVEKLASAQATKIGVAKGTQLAAPDVIALAGREVAEKFATGSAYAAFTATAYARSAGSTYATLSGALSQELNPDGTQKYTPSEVKEIAFAHANAAGLFTAATVIAFQATGNAGMESILRARMTPVQLRKVMNRLRKDVSGITDDATVGQFLQESYRKSMSPILKDMKDEAAQEFLDGGFQHINEKLATGEPINIPELFKEAAYGALLGGIMGGTASGIGTAVQSRQQVDANAEADIRRTRLLEVAGRLQETSPKTAQVLRNYAFNQRRAIPQIRAKEQELQAATTPEEKERIAGEIETLKTEAQTDPLADISSDTETAEIAGSPLTTEKISDKTNDTDTTEENIPEAPAEGGTDQEAGDEGMAPRRRVEARELTTPAGARMRTRESVTAAFEEVTGRRRIEPRSLTTPVGERMRGAVSPEQVVSPIRETAPTDETAQPSAQTAPETGEVREIPRNTVQEIKLKYGGRQTASGTILSPKFETVGKIPGSVDDKIARTGYEDLEYGEGAFFDGKWQDYPFVSVKPIGEAVRTFRFSSAEQAQKFADYLSDLNDSRFNTTPLPEMRDTLLDQIEQAELAAELATDSAEKEFQEAKAEQMTAVLRDVEAVLQTEGDEAAARVEAHPLSADPADIVAVSEARDVAMVDAVKPESAGTPATVAPLSPRAIQTLLNAKRIGDFSGPSNADARAAVMSEIAGKKVPKAKAGVNAFVDAVAAHFGVSKEGKTIAGYESDVTAAIRKAAEPDTGESFGIEGDTPMLRQYKAIKRTLPKGSLLTYRVGDFYEFFGDDARTTAPLMEVALTKRGGVPMSGIPYHAARSYFKKLTDAGNTVAVSDQPSDVKPGQRKVTEILSPEPTPTKETPISDILTEVPSDYPVTEDAARLVAAATVHPGGLANALHANPEAREAAAALLAAKGIAAYKESDVKSRTVKVKGILGEKVIRKDWTTLTEEEGPPPLSRDLIGYNAWRREVAAMVLPEGTDIQKEALVRTLAEAITEENYKPGIESWQHHIIARNVAAQLMTGKRKDILEKTKEKALGDEYSQWFMGGVFEEQPISVEAFDTHSKNPKLPEGYVKQGELYVFNPAPPEPLDATDLAVIGEGELKADAVIAGLAGTDVPVTREVRKTGIGTEPMTREREAAQAAQYATAMQAYEARKEVEKTMRADYEAKKSTLIKKRNVLSKKIQKANAGFGTEEINPNLSSADQRKVGELKAEATKIDKELYDLMPPTPQQITEAYEAASALSALAGTDAPLTPGTRVLFTSTVPGTIEPTEGTIDRVEGSKVYVRKGKTVYPNAQVTEVLELRSSETSTVVQSELNAFGISDGIPAFLANVAKRGGKNYAPIAKLLLDAGAGNVEVRIVNLPNTDAAGFYVGANGVVHINTARNGPRGAVDTVLHELLHAVTEDSLRNPTPAQAKAIAKLGRVRQTVIKRAKARGIFSGDLEYALGNDSEFLTHFFTSPEFRDTVTAMTPKAERNWVQVIADIIADIVHGRLRTRAERMSDSLRKDLVTLIQSPVKGLNSGDMIRNLPSDRTPPPDFKAAEEKFNKQINEYVTGEWPDSAEGRYDALMSFAGQWAATYVEVPIRVEGSPQTRSQHTFSGADDTFVRIGGASSLPLSQRVGVSEFEAKRLIANEINEEVIHYLHHEYVRETLGGATNNEVADNIRGVYMSMLTDLEFAKAAYESYIAYYGQDYDAVTAADPRAKMTEELSKPEHRVVGYHAASEAVRQAVQLRNFGRISEELHPTLWENMIQWFRDRLAAIRSFASRTEVLGERMERDVLETERALNELRGIRFQPATARDVARFNQLTEPLYRGRDSATAAEIQAFREANPDAWAELSRMREEVLREMGYDVKAYHGTNADFTKFTPSRIGNFGPGVYVALDESSAKEYAKRVGGSNVIEGFAKITNPITGGDANQVAEKLFSNFPADSDAETVRLAQEAGYDAVWADETLSTQWGDSPPQINLFDPSQIKTASPLTPGQKITPDRWADAASPDIRFQPAARASDRLSEEGHTMLREDFDAEVAKMKPLPREVFYVGDVEVVRNPTSSDYQTMAKEVRSELSFVKVADPTTRFTQDERGNRWIWKAHQGMHSQVEPGISRREGVAVNQNATPPSHSDIVKQAIRDKRFIPDEVKAQYPQYAEFFDYTPTDDIRFQPPATDAYTSSRISDTVSGFLPDGITPDDIGIDLAQLAEDVSELNPVNAENYVHAVTNRELAKHVARKTLGDDVPESEVTRITEAYELITRGRLEGSRMAHFRTNPTALARLIGFLKEAITSLYGRLTARYDNGTAMLVNRLARELAHAREGFNHDLRSDRGWEPGLRMQPAFRPGDAQGFYSQLERTVEAKIPNRATPEQIMATVNAAGVKAEEVKWSGIEAALPNLAVDGKVPKDALLAYLRDEGAVRFEEVTLGGETSRNRAIAIIKENDNLGFDSARQAFDAIAKDYARDPETLDNWDFNEGDRVKIEPILKRSVDERNSEATKFEQYVLPGGENYREVVLAMPPKSPVSTRINPEGGGYDVLDAEGRVIGTYTGKSPEDAMRKARENGPTASRETYTSSHFPDVPNYVAHMRVNERDGGLFIEEIQSDRHQAGRKKGYASDRPSPDEIIRQREEIYRAADAGEITTDERNRRIADLGAAGGIADAPFRTTWPLAMFKRALRDAVEGGKDWIGWTVGGVHTDRWGTERIEWAKQSDGSFLINAKSQHGGNAGGIDLEGEANARNLNPQNSKTVTTEAQLVEAIRPALTEGQNPEALGAKLWKRMQTEGSGVSMPRKEGFEGFYDRDLKSMIDGYIKVWKDADGNKPKAYLSSIETEKPRQGAGNEPTIGEIADFAGITVEEYLNLPSDEQRKLNRDAQKSFAAPTEATPIWRIDITPTMRETISTQGQVRFLPSTLPSVAVEPPMLPSLQSIVEAPSANSGFLTLLDNDPATLASADKPARTTKVGQWAEGLFVSSMAGVAESMSNAKVRRDATIRAVEMTVRNLGIRIQKAVEAEETDIDTIRVAMGNTDPLITEAAASRIENDYKNFIADSEADIARERKEMFPEYRETLDRMLAAAKDDAARERAYAAAEAAFNKAYNANAELRAESDAFFNENMAAVEEKAEQFRTREIIKETKAETARLKANQKLALNRLAITSPDTFEAVLEARKFANDLQREVSRISGDKPEFQMIVDNSIGIHLVRSYQIHQDPKMADKILHPKEPELIAAREGFIQYLTPIAEEQVFRELERDSEFLKDVSSAGDYDATLEALRTEARKRAEGRALALFEDFILGHGDTAGSAFGGSSVSNEIARYMKKVNLPEEMQRVLQVNTDPVFNFAYTAMSLGRLITNQKLLTNIRDSGIESGRFITEAEKNSGITYAKGRDTMRRVFAEDGNTELKQDVRDKVFVTLRAALDSRFNAGMRDAKPDAEEVSQRVEEAFKFFAEGGRLADALPEIGDTADRIATDHFITSPKLGINVRETMLPEPGRFRGYEPVISPNEGNAAFRPLGGLYASKDDAEAFRASFKTGRKTDEDSAHKLLGAVNKVMIGAAGASLAVVTLGNPGYYGRNIIGGLFMAASQGVDFTNADNWKLATDFVRQSLKPNGEISPEFQELIAGRIAFDGAKIGYLMQLLDEVGANPNAGIEDLVVTANKADMALGKAAKKGKAAYRALIGKLSQFAEVSEVLTAVMTYNDFKTKLREANFGTEQEIMQEASRLTKKVMPSKSEASSIVNAFTGSGLGALMAPFLRFKAEVIRNTVNTPQVAMEWIRSDNPVLKKYGRRKMAAFVGVYGLFTVAMPIIVQRLISGISDDEDEAIRASLPVYLRNSSLYYIKGEDGVRILNMTYTNPLSFSMDPISRMSDALLATAINGDVSELGEIPAIMGRFIAEDFIGENIVAGKLMDTRRNRDDNGFPIYLESDTDLMKAWKNAMHIVEGSYNPKVISQAIKLKQALGRNTEEADFWYTPEGVVAATFAPFRVMSNSYDDIERKAFANQRRQLGEMWQITSRIFSPQPISAEEMIELYEDRVKASDRINAQTLKFAKAFTELRGGDERAVERNMVDAGISKKKARLLMGGGVAERVVFSKDQMQDAFEKHGQEARSLFDHIITSRPALIPVEEK